ncbi:DUF2812 domain-containing protein [Bacillus sp. JJ1503]|uniref:DUF2812 domain-containing protein n=1 Tax=unclassified Bacillus (in: firmicutes) TaxID=185979 RepID=UPI002FFDA2EE
MKKMKWLWSYRIDQTERWLTQMSNEGYRLVNFNHWSRKFRFQEGQGKKATYAVHYGRGELAHGLTSAGWELAASSGKWQILKNEISEIEAYPARDAILKHTRMHAYLFLLITMFMLSIQVPALLVFGTIFSITKGQIGVLSIAVPVIILLFLIGLTVFVFRAYRRFELSVMDMTIEKKGMGQRVRKLYLGWMYQPFQTKEWLEKMASEGLELESVFGAVFTFRKTKSQKIIYEVSFEPKVNANYFALHKEMGWKLKFTSNITWLNYSIWARSYSDWEEVPAFTYDLQEKRRYMKKAFTMNVGMGVFLLFICIQSLYVNVISKPDSFFEWSFSGFLKVALLLLTVMWIVLLTKIIAGYRKELKMLNG